MKKVKIISGVPRMYTNYGVITKIPTCFRILTYLRRTKFNMIKFVSAGVNIPRAPLGMVPFPVRWPPLPGLGAVGMAPLGAVGHRPPLSRARAPTGCEVLPTIYSNFSKGCRALDSMTSAVSCRRISHRLVLEIVMYFTGIKD